MSRSDPEAVGPCATPVQGGVLVAGGGTAGHLLPGLAVARALLERSLVDTASEVHLVGSRRGVEAEMVPAAGFGLTMLPGRGIQRRVTPANVVAVVGLLAAFWRALWLMARRRPRVLLATGGYASVACGLAAAVLRVPMVLAEQNAVPGAANRLLARFAAASAVSFPSTGLPREVLTGNPVRTEVRALRDRDSYVEARERLGVDDRPLLLVFGGSLGARRINRAVVGALTGWRAGEVIVHHVVGRRDWPAFVGEVHEVAPGVDYRPVEFEASMPTLMAAADLVVSRAGATTVAELTAIGRPSVLVPLPGAPGDHQGQNAARLVRAGAAVAVPDGEFDAARLLSEVGSLLADRTSLAAMAESARRLGRPDAADRVADLLVGAAGGPGGSRV